MDEFDHVSRETERLVGGYDGLVDLRADLLALFLIPGQIRLRLLQQHRVGGQFGDRGFTALDFFGVGGGVGEKFIYVKLDEQLLVLHLLHIFLNLHHLLLRLAEVVADFGQAGVHVLVDAVALLLDPVHQSLVLLLVLVQVFHFALDVEERLFEFLFDVLPLRLVVRQVFDPGHLQRSQLVIDGGKAGVGHLGLVKRVLNGLHSVLEIVQLVSHFKLYLLLQDVLVVHERFKNRGYSLSSLRFLHKLVNIRLFLPKLQLSRPLLLLLLLHRLLLGLLRGLDLLERGLNIGSLLCHSSELGGLRALRLFHVVLFFFLLFDHHRLLFLLRARCLLLPGRRVGGSVLLFLFLGDW